jgi:hypothetical protein
MHQNYPKWVLPHIGKEYSLRGWLEIIADFYNADFYVHPHAYGCPTKLTKEAAISLFLEFSNWGFMTYALEEVGINRSTLWRWRNQFSSIHDMHILTTAYVQQQKAANPKVWETKRAYQMILLQQKKGVISSLPEKLVGRSSLYNPEKHTEVESTLEATAEKLGVSKRTVITWMQKYPEFKKKMLLKRLDWQLPMFEKQIERLEAEGFPSGVHYKNSNSHGEPKLNNARDAISLKV